MQTSSGDDRNKGFQLSNGDVLLHGLRGSWQLDVGGVRMKYIGDKDFNDFHSGALVRLVPASGFARPPMPDACA